MNSFHIGHPKCIAVLLYSFLVHYASCQKLWLHQGSTKSHTPHRIHQSHCSAYLTIVSLPSPEPKPPYVSTLSAFAETVEMLLAWGQYPWMCPCHQHQSRFSCPQTLTATHSYVALCHPIPSLSRTSLGSHLSAEAMPQILWKPRSIHTTIHQPKLMWSVNVSHLQSILHSLSQSFGERSPETMTGGPQNAEATWYACGGFMTMLLKQQDGGCSARKTPTRVPHQKHQTCKSAEQSAVCRPLADLLHVARELKRMFVPECSRTYLLALS